MAAYLFDSNALIYSAIPTVEYKALRELLLLPAPSGAASAISLVEVLGFSGLTARDRQVLEATFESLTIIPIADFLIEAATELASRYGLKATDAIIAASALATNRTLITSDGHFRRVPGLTVLHPAGVASSEPGDSNRD